MTSGRAYRSGRDAPFMTEAEMPYKLLQPDGTVRESSAPGTLAAQAGCNHSDPDAVFQVIVISGSEYHMCIGRRIGTDGIHGQFGFCQFE